MSGETDVPLLRLLTAIETGGMVFFFTTALAAGVMQVVMRYVFNTGFVWSDVVFVRATVFAALFGASRAVRDGLHVRVDLFVDWLAPGARRLVELVNIAINLAFLGLLLWAAYLYVEFMVMTGTRDLDTGVPEWLFFLIVPVFLSGMIIRYAALVPATLRSPSGDPWKPNGGPAPPTPSAH